LFQTNKVGERIEAGFQIAARTYRIGRALVEFEQTGIGTFPSFQVDMTGDIDAAVTYDAGGAAAGIESTSQVARSLAHQTRWPAQADPGQRGKQIDEADGALKQMSPRRECPAYQRRRH
jgi:hypothetical protein